MLKFFNRLEKTRNFVLLLFAILMVVSLVFVLQAVRCDGRADLAHSEETAAKVAGEKITVGELVPAKENITAVTARAGISGKDDPERLIGSRIARVEAERLGLTGVGCRGRGRDPQTVQADGRKAV